jgi:putative N6-adenine-specific DNA methylase
MLKFLHITFAPGLNELVQDELIEAGIISDKKDVFEPHRGGLKIAFSPEALVKTWTRSRLCTSALIDIGTFYCESLDEIYSAAKALELEKIFGPMPNFRIDISGEMPSNIKFSQAPLKMKDAICDRQREIYGYRPSVDRDDPDLRIVAHFQGPKVHISFDLFNEPLHKRGYRAHIGSAPIKENKAAALLRFAGYTGAEVLVDPFCGSGTIALEALMIQRQIWPGLLKQFPKDSLLEKVSEGLSKLLSAELDWCEEQFKQKQAEGAPFASILASDADPGILRKARKNLELLGHGMENEISFIVSDVLDLDYKDALWVCNPPYGERLEGEGPDGEIEELMRDWGYKLKHTCAPARIAIIYPKSPELNKLGFKPSRNLDVPSGPIATRFWFYEVRPR